jgi:hypothetical protein
MSERVEQACRPWSWGICKMYLVEEETSIHVCGDTHITAHLLPFSNTPTVWLQLLLRCTNGPFLRHQQTALSASTSESHYASHICQLTNGRAGWPANFCITEGSSGRNIHSTLSSSTEHIKTTRRKKLRPTARPRCLVDRALHRPAEHHA